MTPATAPAVSAAPTVRTAPHLRPTSMAPTPAWSALVLRWLRRLHLYSGLAMLPFVLIYGISAFLFNHAGGTQPVSRPLPLAPGAIAVDAAALAAAVAAARDVPRDVPRDDAANGRLDGAWTFEFDAAEGRQRLSLRTDGSAVLRPVAARERRTERVPESLFTATQQQIAQLAENTLAAAGITPSNLRRVGSPNLHYTAGDREVTTSLERATVTERSAGFDLGRLLTRLHVAHGYDAGGARDVWAVLVDVMAASMVLWSLSGLTMWWQRRSHRVAGGIVLVVTVIGATALAYVLNSLFTR